MAGFTSHDDFINQTTVAGKFYRSDWNKNTLPTTAQAAGLWYCLAAGTGNPSIDAQIGSGSALGMQFYQCVDSVNMIAASGSNGGNIVTTTFTDTIHGSNRFTVGMYLTNSGSNILAGTQITALGTGTGANAGGTYTINNSQTSASIAVVGTAYPSWIQHGGTVGSASVVDYKQILNASAFSAAATTMPMVMMLVDVLGFYCIPSVATTGDQALTSGSPLPRYTDGKGVRAFIVPSIVMAANTPNIKITYTAATTTGSVAGHITPAVLPVGNSAAPVGSIVYSGTAAGKYGPFLPMQGGDLGILSVQQFNLSSTYGSGVLNLVLCKPLFTLPMTTIGVASERDFMNQLPSLPKVYDGACLAWLCYAGANTPTSSSFFGHIDLGWG